MKGVFSAVITALAITCAAQPGPAADGSVRLANGWLLDPVGTHVPIGGWGRALACTRGGEYAAVVIDVASGAELVIVEPATHRVDARLALRDARPSLAWDGTDQLVVAGGSTGCAYVVARRQESWTVVDSLYGHDAAAAVCAVAVQRGRCLIATDDSVLAPVEFRTHARGRTTAIHGMPTAILASEVKNRAFVTSMSANVVDVVNTTTGALVASIPVARHPRALAEDAVGERLFVACAFDNVVMAIDLRSNEVVQRIGTSPIDVARKGTTPCALSLSPNGQVLALATADLNMLTLYDVHEWGRTAVAGYIPTERLPVGVAFGDHQIIAFNAYGIPAAGTGVAEYASSLSLIPLTGSVQLRSYMTRATRTIPALGGDTSIKCPHGGVVPDTAGGPSPIKHVVLVVKGGRSFDELFGDMPGANGAREGCRFPQEVTPNQHALAQRFALLDNVYTDADVREEGETSLFSAYVPLSLREAWARYRGKRGQRWVFTGQDATLVPPVGYLWDYCDWRGKRMRVYGAFTETREDTLSFAAPGVEDNLSMLVCQAYPSADRTVSDTERVAIWSQELAKFEERGVYPAVSVVMLANERTGTEDGVRDCDRAIGQLVERMSASSFWPSTVVMVVETDADGARDHVDPHRVPALLISPYVRRGTIDHTMYSTAGLLHLLERFVGIPPMSLYDGLAPVPCAPFTGAPDLAPFTVVDSPSRGH